MSDILSSDPVETNGTVASDDTTVADTTRSDGDSWTSSLSDDTVGDVNFSKYRRDTAAETVEQLAQANRNLNSVVGSDKIAIPTDASGDEAWNEAYTKLGRPETADGYKFGEGSDEVLTAAFAEKAHELGFNQKQLDGGVGFFEQLAEQEEEKNEQAWRQFRETSEADMRKEHGNKYDEYVGTANRAFNQFVDSDTQQYLAETGMSNHPGVVKMFNQIGRRMMEDSVNDPTTATGFRSPVEAKKAISAIQNDPKHPYFHKDHPNYRAAVEEMENLYADANPETK